MTAIHLTPPPRDPNRWARVHVTGDRNPPLQIERAEYRPFRYRPPSLFARWFAADLPSVTAPLPRVLGRG